jgi:hypothetical protein
MIQQFLLAHGTFDTKKDQATAEYDGIGWKEIAALVQAPQAVEKVDAKFIIPSFYRAFDGRSHDAQRERGSFGMLALDIDSGSPSMGQVILAVQEVLGLVSMLVYSSASSSSDLKKWRVLIPIKDPIAGADYSDMQSAFFRLLKGIEADPALARPGQPVYLPNVPPDRRAADGEPLFYQSQIIRGVTLDLEASAVYDEFERKRERDAILMEQAQAERAERMSQQIARCATGDTTPVEEFNKANTVADMLTRCGYSKGKKGQWQSPYQQSGTFATKDFGDYWISLSGSDSSAGIGTVKDGYCWGDAFDLFVHFDHGGDYQAAVRAYGREIRPQQARAAEIARDDTGSPFAPVEVIDDGEVRGGWFDWTYLKARGVFRNIQTGEECKTDAFNLAYGSIVPDTVAPNGRTYRPTAAKYVLNDLQVEQAHDVLYWPMAARYGMFFEHDRVKYVNAYLPNRVPRAEVSWESHDAWRVIQAHLQQILPEDWEQLVKWMAHNVQHPGLKILWAPIIKGIPGDGKTTIYRIMMAVMGEKNVREISTQELTSEFNAWAEGACVAVLEEIRIKGHNRHDAMNKLKPVVTNTTVSVVRKGRDGRNIPNCTTYMALTNHEDALVLDADDRRWGVFFTKYQNREELLAETNKDYWDRLHSAYQDHPGVIRGWLENVDLSGFDRNEAPSITKAKRRMIELSRSESETAVAEAIDLGGYGICKEVVVTDCLNVALKQNGDRVLPPVILYKTMTGLGYERVEHTFKWKNKARRIYVHKSKTRWLDPDEVARGEIRELLDRTADGVPAPF